MERTHVKRVWVKYSWHVRSRLSRKVLSHTIGLLLNSALGNPPWQLALLLDQH